ncbi:MAG: hypothetical protein NPIRA06_24930 [Nitrospirales bacterium]|nr:MAG: hypothetical protein NPIRA06_24930 [Nitrospirales bacterium]
MGAWCIRMVDPLLQGREFTLLVLAMISIQLHPAQGQRFYNRQQQLSYSERLRPGTYQGGSPNTSIKSPSKRP